MTGLIAIWMLGVAGLSVWERHEQGDDEAWIGRWELPVLVLAWPISFPLSWVLSWLSDLMERR